MSEDGDSQVRAIPGLPASEAAALNADIGPDDTGTREAQLLSQGFTEPEIKRRAARKEHERDEKFKDHFECVAIVGLWSAAIILGALGLTWFWHLLMPESCHWLSQQQVAKLQNIVTGGILASIATGHMKKRIG